MVSGSLWMSLLLFFRGCFCAGEMDSGVVKGLALAFEMDFGVCQSSWILVFGLWVVYHAVLKWLSKLGLRTVFGALHFRWGVLLSFSVAKPILGAWTHSVPHAMPAWPSSFLGCSYLVLNLNIVFHKLTTLHQIKAVTPYVQVATSKVVPYVPSKQISVLWSGWRIKSKPRRAPKIYLVEAQSLYFFWAMVGWQAGKVLYEIDVAASNDTQKPQRTDGHLPALQSELWWKIKRQR